jgi:hypothetical protein
MNGWRRACTVATSGSGRLSTPATASRKLSEASSTCPTRPRPRSCHPPPPTRARRAARARRARRRSARHADRRGGRHGRAGRAGRRESRARTPSAHLPPGSPGSRTPQPACRQPATAPPAGRRASSWRLSSWAVDTVGRVERHQIHRRNGVDHKPRQVPLRRPLTQARRQQQRLLTITPDEVLRHAEIVIANADRPPVCATASATSDSGRARRWAPT